MYEKVYWGDCNQGHITHQGLKRGNNMLQLAWLTDTHFDFLQDHKIKSVCETILTYEPDGVLITGDISNAPSLKRHLLMLEQYLQCPIYFVLGNHDFYGGSIEQVRAQIQVETAASQYLHWLPACEWVKLTENTCLIGHDGWADGRLGQGVASEVLLNDFFHIKEFIGLSHIERFQLLNKLGDQAAVYFQQLLPTVIEQFSHVLLLTHVPPFKAACWYEGKVANDEYLPHFASQVVGEVLVDMMRDYPATQLTVLCGHTHNEGVVEIAPNLLVKTAAAEYGSPGVYEMIEV